MSALRASTLYPVLSMFFSIHSKAFCISFSSKLVIVISLGLMRVPLRNEANCRSRCSRSWRMRLCNTSMSNGLAINESAPASYAPLRLSEEFLAVSRMSGMWQHCTSSLTARQKA